MNQSQNATWRDAHDPSGWDLDEDDDAFWTSATGPVHASAPPVLPERAAPTRDQVQAACALVDRYRDRLACRGVTNPAGAWYRWLIVRFQLHQGPGLVAVAARYDRALATMAGESRDGKIWLSTRRVTHYCR